MENLELGIQTNPFHDSNSLPSTHTNTHNLSPHRNNHHHHLTIFPPFNHEDLPLPLPPPPQTPPQAPPAFQISNSNPHSTPPSPPLKPQLLKWFDFALHFWKSKLFSFYTLFRSSSFFSSLLPLASTLSFLALFLFFFRRRRRRLRSNHGNDSVDHLKLLIKEKDEKIVQLLEQIAQLNKVLLARYKIPVLRAS